MYMIMSLENNILELLNELRSYGATGLKAEFESEGATFDDVLLLKQYADRVGLNLSLKIGGCEAVRDIFDAKKLAVDTIVAPMVETSFAMKKFVRAVKSVFSDDKKVQLLINIETDTGIKNLDEILNIDNFEYISGIVVGRTDLSESLSISEVDSSTMFNIVERIAKKMKLLNKQMILGGNISPSSVTFLRNLPYLTNFETRKVIFDANKIVKSELLDEAINKAIEFELLWLQNKILKSKEINQIDLNRLEVLKKRLTLR